MLAVYAAFPALWERPNLTPVWRFLAFVQNLGLRGGTAFSHAWSLSVEGQFYLVLPLVLGWIVTRRQAGVAVAAGLVLGGAILRGVLASSHLTPAGEIDGRAYLTLIYYPTWSRLDPLVFGVGLAAVRHFRLAWWARLLAAAPFLLLPGMALVAAGVCLLEADGLPVTACTLGFPLIALGLAGLLVCAVSERLPLCRVPVPGAAFLASIAYSVYLSHKLVIHQAVLFCSAHGWARTSAAALGLNVAAILLVGALLYAAVERPFLRWRG